jgi:hypothetical protein
MLVCPTRKLKTVDHLYRDQGKTVPPDSTWLFLDRLNARYGSDTGRREGQR